MLEFGLATCQFVGFYYGVITIFSRKQIYGIVCGIKRKIYSLYWGTNSRLVASEPFCPNHYATKTPLSNKIFLLALVKKWSFQCESGEKEKSL